MARDREAYRNAIRAFTLQIIHCFPLCGRHRGKVMPLLGLDAYAYPFVAVKIEVAAFALPDPGLLRGVTRAAWSVRG